MIPTPVQRTGAAGNRLVADAYGADGHPVLMLHGGGQTRQAWSHVAGRMAARGLSPIAVDQRGHGDSEWIAGGGYTFFDFGSDAGALAETVATETGIRPVAVGASLGGIASLLAQGQADRFGALILVDVTPSLNADGVARVHRFMTKGLADGFGSLDEAAAAVADYLPNRRPTGSSKGLAKNLRLSPDGRYRWHWDPAFIDGPNSVATRRDAARAELVAAANALDIPTLRVRGGRSDIVTEAEIAEFRQLAPSAEFVDIAGAGHMVAGDRNDVFGDAVLDFLARHGFAAGPP
ncbi:alpha/beta hydrolase [Aurantimonas sp. A2-1-M11]|uniref:alpha/beta fold hydrolase n=1 Tax=Aurantimonas sp. A2-1-M11 TaxID=3113712 RepID=UPI002F95A981